MSPVAIFLRNYRYNLRKMKKIIAIAISLVFAIGLLKAQAIKDKVKEKGKAEIKTKVKAEVKVNDKFDTINASNAFVQSPGIISISQMDQRKIYRWGNGQSSTAAGRQAGDPTAKYARVFGDSAVVVRDWPDKIKRGNGGTAGH